MRRGLGVLALAMSACHASALPVAAPVEGTAVPAESARAAKGESPTAGGRVPRRLDVGQLRASLVAATGFGWVGRRRVADRESPKGYDDLPDADMIEALAATLGRADYRTTTSDAIDPAITFTKLAGDAARSACRASVRADLAEPSVDRRRILRFVGAEDTLAANGAGARKNLSYLTLRFWGRTIATGDPELEPLAALFDRASRASSPADGWRAVCIALATDPQFLAY